MKDIIKDIRESHQLNKAQFARTLGVSGSIITYWEKGERVPAHREIGALLRVARPEQQKALLEALGIEDVERFAFDILASAGVVLEERVVEVDRLGLNVPTLSSEGLAALTQVAKDEGLDSLDDAVLLLMINGGNFPT